VTCYLKKKKNRTEKGKIYLQGGLELQLTASIQLIREVFYNLVDLYE
jgi:hypothetical protein